MHGVPVTIEDRGEFTPVTDLLDSIDDPAQRRLFRLIWEHTANQEMRYQKRVDDSDAAKLRVELDIHQNECLAFKVDLVGKNGNDGRIGELRKAVESSTTFARWLIRFAIGSIVGAAIALVLAGRWVGDVGTRVDTLNERVKLLEGVTFLHRFAPALEPEKDSP